MENEIPKGSARVVWEIDHFDDELDAAEDATDEQLALAHAKAVHSEHFHSNQSGWVYHVCIRGAWYAVDLEDDTAQLLVIGPKRRLHLAPDPLGTVQPVGKQVVACETFHTTLLGASLSVGHFPHPTTKAATLCLHQRGVVYAYRDIASDSYEWVFTEEFADSATDADRMLLYTQGYAVEDMVRESWYKASYTEFILILLANRGKWVEAMSSAHDVEATLDYYRIVDTKSSRPTHRYVYEMKDTFGRAIAWDYSEDAHLSFLVAGYSETERPWVPVMTQKGVRS